MLSLTHLRPKLNYVFQLAEHAAVQIDINYKRQIYVLTIEPTGEPHKPKIFKKRPKKKGIQLQTRDCIKCGGLEMNGICLSSECSGIQI